jgi:hypothetical protein
VCSEKEVRCERADPYGGRYHALPPTPESHPASPDSGCPAQDTVKEEEEEEEEGGDLVVHLYQGESENHKRDRLCIGSECLGRWKGRSGMKWARRKREEMGLGGRNRRKGER